MGDALKVCGCGDFVPFDGHVTLKDMSSRWFCGCNNCGLRSPYKGSSKEAVEAWLAGETIDERF